MIDSQSNPGTRRRVIIADDEPFARERLRMLLEPLTQYEIVRECEYGEEAVEAIVELRPDLVFLDIRMPGLSGIEVAEVLEAHAGGHQPQIIFVTAYEEYALRAIEVRALDYLLKPIDRERLQRALARAEERLAKPADAMHPELREFLERLRAEQRVVRRFLVRDLKGVLSFVRADEIDWVDAQGNYMRLHAGSRTHLVRDTMKSFETKLDPNTFIRVHRSALVNLDRVESIQSITHGEYQLTLRDGTRIRSSRAYSGRLQELLRSS